MKEFVESIIDKQEWLTDLGMANYSPAQQKSLWDLILTALQTKTLDLLLDQLSAAKQRQLIQYISEDDLQPQLPTFLQKNIPNYQELLNQGLLEYKKQLKRDLSRLVKKPTSSK